MNKNVSIIFKFIIQSIKSARQVSLSSAINLNRPTSTTSKILLSVGLGPHDYHLKRSSKLIDTLSELNLFVSNEKICI